MTHKTPLYQEHRDAAGHGQPAAPAARPPGRPAAEVRADAVAGHAEEHAHQGGDREDGQRGDELQERRIAGAARIRDGATRDEGRENLLVGGADHRPEDRPHLE